MIAERILEHARRVLAEKPQADEAEARRVLSETVAKFGAELQAEAVADLWLKFWEEGAENSP